MRMQCPRKMALIKCKECGEKVSTKAKNCPACGAPIKRTSGCAVVLLVLLGVSIIACIGLVQVWKEAAKNPPDLTVKSGSTKTVGGYLASPSKDALQMAIRYATQNDEAAVSQMVNSGQVIWLKAGLDVHIVESGGTFSGMVKIRPHGSTMELWTVSEAVR